MSGLERYRALWERVRSATTEAAKNDLLDVMDSVWRQLSESEQALLRSTLPRTWGDTGK